MKMLLIMSLFIISACQFHLVTPVPPPVEMGPKLHPPTVSLMPTITPTPEGK